jgi:precorrin-6Y C5,15-methyltransferase (decarboxylating)
MINHPPWLAVVGIGADGLGGLGARARQVIAGAEVLVGGRRHLAMVPEDGRARLAWRSPLGDTLADIEGYRGRAAVVVLATGDPLWFGVGRLLVGRFGAGEVRVVPHTSAFQEAAARLGWALEEVATVTLHGRPLDRLRRYLAPGGRVLALTEGGAAPAAVAALLRGAGYGPSRMWVLEELAGAGERAVATTAGDVGPGERFAELNVVAVELRAGPGAVILPVGVALPDGAFEHDGQLTKREVRAVTLASLAPLPGELLWDVGAGAGSVAIDWLRAGPDMRAVAVERDPARAARARANAARLGVPELAVAEGEAPAALAGLPAPDAVFVGGGVADPGLMEACWAGLRPGGRLVANAVTLAGEAALLACGARWGGRLTRLALCRAEPLGGELAWRPALPITQLVADKPCVAES